MNNLRSLFGSVTSRVLKPLTAGPVSALSVQLDQQRFAWRPVHPPIRGAPRPLPPGKLRPLPNKYNWLPIYPTDGKYTIRSLKIRKLGGRDPETGRVVVKTVGGGNKKYFRWVDPNRAANKDGTPREEKVYQIRYDPLRSTQLALVGGGDKLRWMQATEKMQVGDVIRTYCEIPRNPVRPREADSHPVGALPIGTKVHNIQTSPGSQEYLVKFAGAFAEITRRVGRRNYLVNDYDKQEMCIDASCMVTVGRLSNPYHDQLNLMCAQRKRWLGKRPRSGAWHRKDGYCGRKIKPPKPVKDFFAEVMIAQKGGKTLNNVDTYKNEFFTLEPF